MRNFLTYLSIMAFFTAVMGGLVYAENGPSTDFTTTGDFEILHHELLELTPSPQPLPPGAKSTQSMAVDSFVLSFQALGRDFELVLESNERLMANLPKAQRERLSSAAQFYRGQVVDAPNSWVRLTQMEGRWSGTIWDGTELYIIDSSDEVADSLQSPAQRSTPYTLIYRFSDTISNRPQEPVIDYIDPATQGGGDATLERDEPPLQDYRSQVQHLKQLVQALPAAALQLDLAIIADVQFVQANPGNPEAAVMARMNVVDGIYSEQVGVNLNTVEIRLLQDNAPLTSTDPLTLLRQLGSFASAPGFTNPGLTHLFTGRDLAGSTVGIAYLRSLCSARFGVGVSEVRQGGTAGALTVAHELGHNFGAPHDNQSGSACASTPNGFIMNPFLNGSDEFSECSLDQMQPEIVDAICITPIDNPDADVRVSFPTNPLNAAVDIDFDYVIEVSNSGAATTTNATATIELPVELVITNTAVDVGSCAQDSGQVDCDLEDINAGDERTITLTLQSAESGRFVSTVTVSADNDSNAGNNTAQATIDIAGDGGGGEIIFAARFDGGTDGFSYADDTFGGTNRPFYARGQFRLGEGFTSGDLRVLLGGLNNADILGMSGGWQRSFTLSAPQQVTVSLRYRLSQAANYEADEFSDALLAIDGTLISDSGNDYLARIAGDGNGGPVRTTGWQTVDIDLGTLSAGTHTLTIGGFNN
ncbi:MAG: M12 family metallo-peptidase, partial [Candidatus Competibacteraceae bacterium]|nr:M12 family metallo-peptidase [Candidatus Competibacteraceae bacterium]